MGRRNLYVSDRHEAIWAAAEARAEADGISLSLLVAHALAAREHDITHGGAVVTPLWSVLEARIAGLEGRVDAREDDDAWWKRARAAMDEAMAKPHQVREYWPVLQHVCAEKRGAVIIGAGDTERCGCVPPLSEPGNGQTAEERDSAAARATVWTAETVREHLARQPLMSGAGEVQVDTERGYVFRIHRRPGGERPPVTVGIYGPTVGATPRIVRLRLTDAEAYQLFNAVRGATSLPGVTNPAD